jgi:Ni,Fe-hydrogenase maturation factor
MKVYVFGNQDYEGDLVAIKAAKKLEGVIESVEFIVVNPNEDLPFAGENNVVILDAMQGINKVTEINETDLGKLDIGKSVTVHDFDLGFQLKYLKKLGKLKRVIIIGLPQEGKIDYLRIQSILRKLVAQDIQGS